MEKELKIFYIVFGVAQVIGVICVGLMLFWTLSYNGGFAWRSNPKLMFNWHPLLLTVGLIYLLANSITIFRALRKMNKLKLKLIHTTIHSIVIVCIIIGLVAIFLTHSLTKKSHLYTLHSWVGLADTIIFVIQWFVSISIFLFPGAPNAIRETFMPWHLLIGFSAFVLAVTSVITGLLEMAIFKHKKNYGMLPGEAVILNSMGILVVIFAVFVVYLTINPKYKRQPRPEDGAPPNATPSE